MYALESQSSRAIKSILDAGRLNYSKVRVDTFKGEHMKPEMLLMNPDGTVPFIYMNGAVHKESFTTL